MSGARTHTGNNLPTAITLDENGLREIYIGNGHQLSYKKDEPVVLLFIDDEGYGDVGCYGATGFETPNIDRLASEGMMFTNFYAAQPVCSVSRAGLLTGCYPNRLGFPGALFPYDTIGLNSEEFTMVEMFKEQGYATACFGK